MTATGHHKLICKYFVPSANLISPRPGASYLVMVKSGCICDAGYEAINTEAECASAYSQINQPSLQYKGSMEWGSAPHGCIQFGNEMIFFRESTAPEQWCNQDVHVICRPSN